MPNRACEAVVLDAGVMVRAPVAHHADRSRKNTKYWLFHCEDVSKEDEQWRYEKLELSGAA